MQSKVSTISIIMTSASITRCNMIQDRVCKACGATFQGGPRAYYCPKCRVIRKQEAKARYLNRLKSGDVRRIGSIDKCDRCGSPYTVESGLQRFCPPCQPIHAAEHDRQTALEFYRQNQKKINPVRNIRRRKRDNRCVMCGKFFATSDGRNTCSPKCKRLRGNQLQREHRERKKRRERDEP